MRNGLLDEILYQEEKKGKKKKKTKYLTVGEIFMGSINWMAKYKPMLGDCCCC